MKNYLQTALARKCSCKSGGKQADHWLEGASPDYDVDKICFAHIMCIYVLSFEYILLLVCVCVVSF